MFLYSIDAAGRAVVAVVGTTVVVAETGVVVAETGVVVVASELVVSLAGGVVGKETYVQITDAGKRLVLNRMAKTLQQRGLRSHMASIETVQAFLKSNRAELLAKS